MALDLLKLNRSMKQSLLKAFYAFILIISWGSPALCAIGFNKNPQGLPKNVFEQWNSVFQVRATSDDNKGKFTIGTASIVKIEDEKIYFLTAQHVIKNSCPEIGPCHKNAKLINDSATPNFSVGGMELISQDLDHDLALIAVNSQFIANNQKKFPTIKTPQQCENKNERSFNIGYPDTSLRTGGQKKFSKQWSSGNVYGEDETQPTGDYNFTLRKNTADALLGNSGGPVVNSKGELIGAVSMARTQFVVGADGRSLDTRYKNQNPWLVNPPTNDPWISLISPCQSIKDIIESPTQEESSSPANGSDEDTQSES